MFINPSNSASLYGQYLKPQSLPTVPQPVAPVPVKVSLDAQCIGEGTVLGCPPGPAFSPPPPQPFSSLVKSGHVAPIGNPSRGGPSGLLVGDKHTESKASYTSLGESKHPSHHLGASKKPSSPSFSHHLGVSKKPSSQAFSNHFCESKNPPSLSSPDTSSTDSLFSSTDIR